MFSMTAMQRSARGAHLITSIVVPMAILLIATPARAQEALHARISFEDGGAMVRGSEDNDWSDVSMNALILPGDTLWADKGGTVEVELPGGTFLRMADTSKAEVVSLPPDGLIRGWNGSFYVQRIKRSTGAVVIQTPSCRIDLDNDTHARIDVIGEGATTLSVRWGVATIHAEGAAPVPVTSGMRCFVDPGLLPSSPQPFDRTVEDGFDSWSRQRAKQLAGVSNESPSPIVVKSAPVGYSDLGLYGEWVYVDSTPYWRPTVVVDYVPYRYGYWSYVPAYGNVWVGNYPFCYVTSHYGRWNYNSGYGWLWSYSDVWAPAWAYTARCGDSFVWAPLDMYNRPCSYGSSIFRIGNVTIGISGGSYCSANSIYYGPGYIHPVTQTVVSQFNTNNVYIWNIFASNQNAPRNPSRDVSPTTLVRDYFPQRSIRGHVSTRVAGAPARDRVATLETSSGRTTFQTATATSQRGARTGLTQAERSARVRDLSINVRDWAEQRRTAMTDVNGLTNSSDSTASRPSGNRNVRSGNQSSAAETSADVSTRSSLRDRLQQNRNNTPTTGDNATTNSRASERTPRINSREYSSSRTPQSTSDAGVDQTVPRASERPQTSDPSSGVRRPMRVTQPPVDAATTPRRTVRGIGQGGEGSSESVGGSDAVRTPRDSGRISGRRFETTDSRNIGASPVDQTPSESLAPEPRISRRRENPAVAPERVPYADAPRVVEPPEERRPIMQRIIESAPRRSEPEPPSRSVAPQMPTPQQVAPPVQVAPESVQAPPQNADVQRPQRSDDGGILSRIREGGDRSDRGRSR